MARMRTIKPGFFQNDQLAEIHPLGRLLFIGLWTIADREGRVEDRPKKFKTVLLGYDDCASEDIDGWLAELDRLGFIQRYEIDSEPYIQIVNFLKHQNPHVREAASTIPSPKSKKTALKAQGKHGASTIPALPDFRVAETAENSHFHLKTDSADSAQNAEFEPQNEGGEKALQMLDNTGKNEDEGEAQGKHGASTVNALAEPCSNSNMYSTTPCAHARARVATAVPENQSAKELGLLAECCELSTRTMGYSSIARLDADLAELRAIQFEFDLLPEFRRWWDANDWRGKKGEPPTILQVRATWASFKKWRANGGKPQKRQYCGKCQGGWIPSGMPGGRAQRCACTATKQARGAQ